MIELAYFEEDAALARAILEAMSREATRRIGRPCTFSLCRSLSPAVEQRILNLEVDAFGRPGVAFDRRALDEVCADPDALFLRFEVEGSLEGCFFGYWEWPDQVTVAGTDFFLDTGMVSGRYRGQGVGRLALTGILLLVHLLECHRVGIAAWSRGPMGHHLVRFYRTFGFEKVKGGNSPHALMMLDLDRAPLEEWRGTLGLPGSPQVVVPPPVGRGARAGRIWPRRDERELVGRLYAAVGLSEALCLVASFQFAYLYLVMERPEWAVVPVMASAAAALVAGIPAGVLADRWSRKLVVLGGGVLSGLGMALVPLAVAFAGRAQLIAACGAFALVGVGETFMGAAAEAWVVDNLHVAGRRDLIDAFFARVRAVAALGAALAAAAALVLLLSRAVNRSLLDLLWFVAGGGFVASAIVAATVPEQRPVAEQPGAPAWWPQAKQALHALLERRALLMMALAVILAALSGVVSDDAFVVSLITKGFDARMFAPLNIADSLIGIVGPLLGIALARKLGATRLLALFLALEAVAASVLLLNRSVAAVLVLYVVLDLLDDVWDPVALARLQTMTPSAHRATIGAIVYELSSVAQIAALGGFGLMLGRHREALEAATPDLLEAFTSHPAPPPLPPTGWFGLPVPDLAIVAFISVGLLAIPFLLAAGRASRDRGHAVLKAMGNTAGTPGRPEVPVISRPESSVPAGSAPAGG